MITQSIIMHATSDCSILGFTQFTQHTLSILYTMNFSGAEFLLVFGNFK